MDSYMLISATPADFTDSGENQNLILNDSGNKHFAYAWKDFKKSGKLLDEILEGQNRYYSARMCGHGNSTIHLLFVLHEFTRFDIVNSLLKTYRRDVLREAVKEFPEINVLYSDTNEGVNVPTYLWQRYAKLVFTMTQNFVNRNSDQVREILFYRSRHGTKNLPIDQLDVINNLVVKNPTNLILVQGHYACNIQPPEDCNIIFDAKALNKTLDHPVNHNYYLSEYGHFQGLTKFKNHPSLTYAHAYSVKDHTISDHNHGQSLTPAIIWNFLNGASNKAMINYRDKVASVKTQFREWLDKNQNKENMQLRVEIVESYTDTKKLNDYYLKNIRWHSDPTKNGSHPTILHKFISALHKGDCFMLLHGWNKYVEYCTGAMERFFFETFDLLQSSNIIMTRQWISQFYVAETALIKFIEGGSSRYNYDIWKKCSIKVKINNMKIEMVQTKVFTLKPSFFISSGKYKFYKEFNVLPGLHGSHNSSMLTAFGYLLLPDVPCELLCKSDLVEMTIEQSCLFVIKSVRVLQEWKKNGYDADKDYTKLELLFNKPTNPTAFITSYAVVVDQLLHSTLQYVRVIMSIAFGKKLGRDLSKLRLMMTDYFKKVPILSWPRALVSESYTDFQILANVGVNFQYETASTSLMSEKNLKNSAYQRLLRDNSILTKENAELRLLVQDQQKLINDQQQKLHDHLLPLNQQQQQQTEQQENDDIISLYCRKEKSFDGSKLENFYPNSMDQLLERLDPDKHPPQFFHRRNIFTTNCSWNIEQNEQILEDFSNETINLQKFVPLLQNAIVRREEIVKKMKEMLDQMREARELERQKAQAAQQMQLQKELDAKEAAEKKKLEEELARKEAEKKKEEAKMRRLQQFQSVLESSTRCTVANKRGIKQYFASTHNFTEIDSKPPPVKKIKTVQEHKDIILFTQKEIDTMYQLVINAFLNNNWENFWSKTWMKFFPNRENDRGPRKKLKSLYNKLSLKDFNHFVKIYNFPNDEKTFRRFLNKHRDVKL